MIPLPHTTPQSSTAVDEARSSSTTMKTLINANSNILSECKIIGEKVNGVEAAIEFLSAKYNEMKTMYDNIFKENEELKKSIKNIQDINIELKDENTKIKSEIDLIQQ